MHTQIQDMGPYVRIQVCNINRRLGDVEPTAASIKAKMEAEHGGVWLVHESMGNRRGVGPYDWSCDAWRCRKG